MVLRVSLPDGTILSVDAGATPADVAARIGPGLAKAAVAARILYQNRREVVDLSRSLPGDCAIAILTASDEDVESLLVLRHSAAHVMAEAVCRLFPEAKLVYGPPIEDGYYYDIDLAYPLTPDDFPRIEEEMARVIEADRPFRRYELPRSEAMVKLRAEGSRYKIDNAERAEGDRLSFYVTGVERGRDFEDLCRGPHVPRTGLIKAFKVRQVSRSHYRGDVNDQPLQRLYGTAFFKKSSLAVFLERLEQAKKRDHRVIGRDLDLFSISESVGSGLVLWLPKGAVVRTQLQNFLTREMVKLGYELVYTPHIGQLGMYRTSGHFPYYEDSQYPAMFESERGKVLQGVLQLVQRLRSASPEERERGRSSVRAMLEAARGAWELAAGLDSNGSLESITEGIYESLKTESGYLLKPMNCPHHIQIYASRARSYRDLPVRLAEYGAVYRYEQSGEIGGLTRVRGFTQDDAHLFCMPEQLQEEMAATVKLTRYVLDTLGLADYRVRVGLRDPSSTKYVGTAENWSVAEEQIRQAARESGLTYSEEPGEAAFYGPKIDFIVKDCLGRQWQLGTVQVDYIAPERFGLTYVGPDNRPHRPVMIHRAPFGSMERFVGILIEHFAGAFPLWLSPVQAGVATVSEKSVVYGRRVAAILRESGLRVEVDEGSEKIGPKKHRFRTAQVNYILVVGEQESGEGTVNVNDRDGRTIGTMPLEQFKSACLVEVESLGRRRVGDGS